MSAQDLAEELKAQLGPGCERIEVAGSIRRGKPEPKDIELVAIYKLKDAYEEDMFGNLLGVSSRIKSSELGPLLETLYAAGQWSLDQMLKRNGPRYKRLRHRPTGTCCDLFIVTAETWGAQFVIRTGPADFSKAIVTRAQARGCKQDDGRLWRIHRDGSRTVIETPTERDYFAALGLPYLEPAERTVRALYAIGARA